LIPPILDEVERVFSGTRRMISWERVSLSAEMIEITEYIVHWIKHKLLSSRKSTKIGTIGIAIESIEDS